MIFDTHVHLTEPVLRDALPAMLSEAKSRGVGRLVTVGYDEASSRDAVALAQATKGVWSAVGLQPEEVALEKDPTLSWVRALAHEAKVVAIGEIGLDYYWTRETRELQRGCFQKQIALAQELGMPVIIHTREAIEETYEMLAPSGLKGIIHCYTGSPEMARRFVDLGFYLGIGGVVTYPSARHVKDTVLAVGLEHLVLETDAPYLSPVPHRGETNRPAFIRDTAEAVAGLLKEDVHVVIRRLEENALSCFRLDQEEETL